LNSHTVPTRETVKHEAKQASREAIPWIKRLGRLGYAAKGCVYIVIGVLAIQTACGAGGKVTDTTGAMQTIAGQPFGELLLSLLAIGLIGYTIWWIVQAIADPENKGTHIKGITLRSGFFVMGVIHAVIAYNAVAIAMHSGGVSGNEEQGWSARLLQQPLGQWIIWIAGIILIGAGAGQLYRAYKATFTKEFERKAMTQRQYDWAKRMGRIGTAAHGIVLGIVGIFLIRTAIDANPNETKGFDGALAELAKQPSGPWILGGVALGLVAYGLHMLVQGRFRRYLNEDRIK
jgi:hypothetical protein